MSDFPNLVENPVEPFLRTDRMPHIWCPGCGIGTTVNAFARALIETAPEQLIWGSDYPHLSFHDKVGTIGLYNKLGEWAPDAATRRRILVDNPARLFGFR